MAELKERKMFSVGGFRGIDYGSSPMEVAATRAVEAKNMIPENGILQKRRGWRMLRDLAIDPMAEHTESKRIHGMHYWAKEELRGWVVHMGNMLMFKCDSHGVSYDQYVTADILDEPSSWIEQNGRLYIICGDIYVFPVMNAGGKPTFQKLTELEDLYIPTTTININCEGEADENVAVLEYPNLLTPRRKNTLVARSHECQEHSITSRDWILDAKIMPGTDMVITCNGTTYINVSHEEGGKKSYIVDRSLYNKQSFEANGNPNLDPSYRGYVIYPYSDEVDYGHGGKITMYFDTCDHDGSASAEVTFCAAFSEEEQAERKRRITGCRIGTLFGADGNTDRLFLSGNPDAPGRIFYSGYQQLDYFADTSYVTAGSIQSNVNGFLRLADNTMAVLKEPGREEFSLYYLTGTLQSQVDESGNVVGGSAMFYVSNGGTDAACINGRSAQNLFGDALMLTNEGVVAIVPPSQTTVYRAIKERGYSLGRDRINQLYTGHAVVYKGCYYLAVDDGEDSCFVADPKYKYTRQGNDVDQSFNYEWWHLDHIPAHSWYVLDGCIMDNDKIIPKEGYENTAVMSTYRDHAVYPKNDDQTLCFGTKDGRICFFETDMMAGYETWKEGENEQDNHYKYSFGANLPTPANGRITKTGTRNYQDRTVLQVYAGMLTLGADRKTLTMEEALWKQLNDGDLLTVANSATGYLLTSQNANLKGIPLYIVKTEENCIQLKSSAEGDVLILSQNSTAESVSGTVQHFDTVSARWITPYFDLGNNFYSKTLLGLSLSAGADSQGLHFGYESKHGGSMAENLIGTEGESLSAFSFLPGEFEVEQSFPASHTVRCNLRNFNYIRFGFVSDVPKPCRIHGLSIYYKINGMNRGVR